MSPVAPSVAPKRCCSGVKAMRVVPRDAAEATRLDISDDAALREVSGGGDSSLRTESRASGRLAEGAGWTLARLPRATWIAGGDAGDADEASGGSGDWWCCWCCCFVVSSGVDVAQPMV